jgi:hypothetical protein
VATRNASRPAPASKVELRGYAFIDALQPQVTALISTIAKGYLPVTGDASLWIECAPGIAINQITNVAIKMTSVRPAVQVVERHFGILEVHHAEQAEVLAAGDHVLEMLNATEADRLKPVVKTSTTITAIDDFQTMLINRDRRGSMILAGQTLYVLEVSPSVYAPVAANAAEKAAEITLVDLVPYGSNGRLYLAGSDSAIAEAQQAALAALDAIGGRDGGGSGGM